MKSSGLKALGGRFKQSMDLRKSRNDVVGIRWLRGIAGADAESYLQAGSNRGVQFSDDVRDKQDLRGGEHERLGNGAVT